MRFIRCLLLLIAVTISGSLASADPILKRIHVTSTIGAADISIHIVTAVGAADISVHFASTIGVADKSIYVVNSQSRSDVTVYMGESGLSQQQIFALLVALKII